MFAAANQMAKHSSQLVNQILLYFYVSFLYINLILLYSCISILSYYIKVEGRKLHTLRIQYSKSNTNYTLT